MQKRTSEMSFSANFESIHVLSTFFSASLTMRAGLVGGSTLSLSNTRISAIRSWKLSFSRSEYLAETSRKRKRALQLRPGSRLKSCKTFRKFTDRFTWSKPTFRNGYPSHERSFSPTRVSPNRRRTSICIGPNCSELFLNHQKAFELCKKCFPNKFRPVVKYPIESPLVSAKYTNN